jgi:2-polyprenyl-6-methoxyphenol hydroxylase-like FAD-dependent oxidoreductase
MPKTDVLIIGSGSAGIFAGVWLAIYNIPFTILERRPGPMEIGQGGLSLFLFTCPLASSNLYIHVKIQISSIHIQSLADEVKPN